MAGSTENIPDDFEVLSTIDTSALASEYIARHKPDSALVRLRVYDFSQTDSPTTRRNLREYLRSDITFMEELEEPGLIRIFDYSDTKSFFWIATQPAKVEKLAKRFDFLASQSLQFRQQLARQFLEAIQRIHNNGVVHRNLSGEAVFLSQDLKILIGDFGLACYSTDQQDTRHDTTAITTVGYQPPEVRDARTFSCDPSCDIFSAGLLVFEILTSSVLPKDHPGEIGELLHGRLNEELAKGTFGSPTAEVILKAASPSPDKRWPSARAFADALRNSFEEKRTLQAPESMGPTATIAMTEPAEPSQTIPIDTVADVTRQRPAPPAAPSGVAETITPLEATHEIWNGRYEILEKIGEGGQAVVYRALDHLTNEEIAIKTMWSRHRNDRAAINRLKQGAMVARSLTHRNIIKTYSVEQRTDADAFGNYVFVCMELIRSKLDLGRVLETRRTAGKKIRLDEALHITRQLLDALIYAHEHTIHRDIKPGNIMLVPRDDRAPADFSDLTKFDTRLIDFGIAKVLSQKHIDVTGKGFRSAHYGAPELADAKTGVDARADLFSVGVIMYQMLAGSIPRKGSPPASKVNKDVSSALAQVIDKAVSADREKRFKTAAEFAKEIQLAVSRFNWVRKAAKIAAMLVIGLCIAATVKYILPEPDYLPVQDSVEILKQRNPGTQIAALDENTVVTYSDIADFASYDPLRQTAIDKLETVQMAGSQKFKRNFSPWRQQEQVWASVAPAVWKIQRIAEDRQVYYARKGAAVVARLMQLSPSSTILSRIRNKAEEAERSLEKRPFTETVLEMCLDAYELAARVHENAFSLAEGSDQPDPAVAMNEKLKNVGELKNAAMAVYDAVAGIDKLKEFGFHQRGEKCFSKADRYYQTFDLTKAEKSFSLLSQVCGTMASVKDQVDFERSDIGLLGTRLIELCYEDVETFEKYPLWKEKLEQAHRKKQVFADYMAIHNLISAADNVPPIVYDRMLSARDLSERGKWDAAKSQVETAKHRYKQYLHENIDKLAADCNSLLTFAFVSRENVRNCQRELTDLADLLDQLGWPQADFAQRYKRCAGQITGEKNRVRDNLTRRATELKARIVKSCDQAAREGSFWNSRLIKNFMTGGENYRNEGIDRGIANWRYVEDLSRLSAIVGQMDQLSSDLEKMLARKDRLDRLAGDIDEAVEFCSRFKGISQQERENYKKWQSLLEQLRAQLAIPVNNTCLIDRSDETFETDFDNIRSAYSEIRTKLPYHRTRVIELMNKTQWLEKTATFVSEFRQRWAGISGESPQGVTLQNLGAMRSYLDSVKDDVDNWEPTEFNQKMQRHCQALSESLFEQHKAVAAIVTAVIEKRSRLDEGIESFEKTIEQISADEDIRDLNTLAAAGPREAILQFRQLPSLLANARQKLTALALEVPAPLQDITVVAGFELDPWLEDFNQKQDRLGAHVSQLGAAERLLPTFQEIDRRLGRQALVETRYYLALRDHALGSMGYADIGGSLDAIEADDRIMRMCSFLAQIGNQNVPRIEDLRQSLSKIGSDISRLKNTEIGTLAQAKAFNKQRTGLLDGLALMRQQLAKLDNNNLEGLCKQGIADAVAQIRDLLGRAAGDDAVRRLTSALWGFFPHQKDWSRWAAFLDLYHVTVSGEQVKLSVSELLSPANEKADVLSLAEIAANPADAFYIDTTQSANFGWARYVVHGKDRTVILTFVPRTSSDMTQPFYMSTREITNSQYKLFMEKYGAEPLTQLKGWSCFGRKNEKALITQTQGQFPPSRIVWDEATRTFALDTAFEQAPVTWVTLHGAQTYARWLGGRLPTVSQFTYAARAGTETLYPWGDDLAGLPAYAHVRSTAWRQAARNYNAARDNPVEIAYPPVGAIKDFLAGKALDPEKTVHTQTKDYPVWPCFTKNSKHNAWGLYDLIGNVWEWCLDSDNNGAPVICGGSSLSPPQYVRPDAKHEFTAQAADVGFRILIPAK